MRLAFRPAPAALSATLPLNVAGAVAPAKAPPSPGVVVTATVGGVASRMKVMALPVKVFPPLSVAVACTVYVPSVCEDHVGSVALLGRGAVVLPVVALCGVARWAPAACQAEPVQ